MMVFKEMNNALYLKSIQENKLPNEIEILSITDRYNEYIMTGLRTIWGVSLDRIETEYGMEYLNYLNKQVRKFLRMTWCLSKTIS
jgi:oxygen-independent coproporphyrinogen-3 oxidase